MNKEFIPYEQALELKELGFDEPCLTFYNGKFLESTDYDFDNGTSKDIGLCIVAPLYQQAFRWLREKYGFTYSVGSTNIGVVHVGTTFLLQDNASFEEAQYACLKKLIEVAINRIS
jgi:hypothetical protein